MLKVSYSSPLSDCVEIVAERHLKTKQTEYYALGFFRFLYCHLIFSNFLISHVLRFFKEQTSFLPRNKTLIFVMGKGSIYGTKY